MFTNLVKKSARSRTVVVRVQQRFNTPYIPRQSSGRGSVSGIVATVFGCTGYLGRHVVNELARIGSQVVIPYRGTDYVYNHLRLMGDPGQIIPFRWDIRDKDSIRTACKKSNVVINLTGRRFDTRNFTMRDVHVEAAAKIAEVTKELDIERLVHVSALGASSNSESTFAKSKVEGEQVVKRIFPNVTIIRPGVMWGIDDDFLVMRAQVLRCWPFAVVVNPDVKVQPAWAQDVAVAIVNSLKTTKTLGKTYELADTPAYTERQIMEWMQYVLKTDKRIYNVTPGGEIEWHLAYWLGQHRRPRYTLDSISLREDQVMSGNFPGFPDLKVVPTPLFSPVGIGSFIHFRPPIHQLDITFNKVPEIPGIEKGTPIY